MSVSMLRLHGGLFLGSGHKAPMSTRVGLINIRGETLVVQRGCMHQVSVLVKMRTEPSVLKGSLLIISPARKRRDMGRAALTVYTNTNKHSFAFLRRFLSIVLFKEANSILSLFSQQNIQLILHAHAQKSVESDTFGIC